MEGCGVEGCSVAGECVEGIGGLRDGAMYCEWRRARVGCCSDRRRGSVGGLKVFYFTFYLWRERAHATHGHSCIVNCGFGDHVMKTTGAAAHEGLEQGPFKINSVKSKAVGSMYDVTNKTRYL